MLKRALREGYRNQPFEVLDLFAFWGRLYFGSLLPGTAELGFNLAEWYFAVLKFLTSEGLSDSF